MGKEPLPALFATFGCDILATDLHVDKVSSGWTKSHQHASNVEHLQHPAVCPPDRLRERVTFRPVDMNDIPNDLTGFDFAWSSCAFEHLGSIRQGKRFIRRMARCLRPGGVAVHTTEYNITSNWRTIRRGESVLFRRCDFEDMIAQLEGAGHAVEPIDFDTGNGTADWYVDEPPYGGDVHLKLRVYGWRILRKLRLGGYACTSLGLIVRAGEPSGRLSERRISA